MDVAVVFDSRAQALRSTVTAEIVAGSHGFVDLGVTAGSYSEAAFQATDAILGARAERAILVSSSALGASFVANKIDGIHAGVCTDTYDARRGGENGINVMCLGADLTATEAAAIVRAFLQARPLNAGRAGGRAAERAAAVFAA